MKILRNLLLGISLILPAADIEGLEVYTRGDAPAEYNSSMGAACGVVVVWTKAR